MIVTYHLKPNTPLTPEQIKRLDALGQGDGSSVPLYPRSTQVFGR